MNKALLISISLTVIACGEAMSEQHVRTGLARRPLDGNSLRLSRAIRQANYQGEYFDGTNRFGRTYSEQCAYEQDAAKRQSFASAYPNGVDEFGRNYDEKTKFDAQFDIEEFLGYTFASPLNEKRTEKMTAPFRFFEEATIEPTVKSRLGTIVLDRETTNVSYKDLKAETLKLTVILECAYGITFSKKGWIGRRTTDGLRLCKRDMYGFSNTNITISVQDEYETETGKGWLGVTISKTPLIEADKFARDHELRAAIEKTQKPVSLSFSKDIDRLPNSSKITTAMNVLSDEFEKDPSASLNRLRHLAGKALQASTSPDSKPKAE